MAKKVFKKWTWAREPPREGRHQQPRDFKRPINKKEFKDQKSAAANDDTFKD